MSQEPSNATEIDTNSPTFFKKSQEPNNKEKAKIEILRNPSFHGPEQIKFVHCGKKACSYCQLISRSRDITHQTQ
jgi:hypothetical protein